MTNKIAIVKAMQNIIVSGGIGYKHLAGLVIQKDWYEPEPGDRPNYKFVYDLSRAYLDYSTALQIPVAESIVYENLVKYITSLAKQDPAYYTRFNGVLFRILHDYSRGEISEVPGGNYDYLKFIVNWWDTFDGRERNHVIYKKFLDYIVGQYKSNPFYTDSIDFCLEWVGAHQNEFVYCDDMNPKKWYGNCGVGFMDNITRGGNG